MADEQAGRAPEVQIVVRPIGTPLPLGFLGLVVATTCFSALQLGWLPAEEGGTVALGVLVFTVPAQLIAAILGFQARDPVAGTGMGVLAGVWAAVALATYTGPPGATSPGLCVLLLAAAAAMLVPAAASLTKLVATAVMVLTSARFAVTGLAELTELGTWKSAAGVVGLVLAVVALYAALALEIEDAKHRTVLPTWRRGTGADALCDDPARQAAGVAAESGVRRQL